MKRLYNLKARFVYMHSKYCGQSALVVILVFARRTHMYLDVGSVMDWILDFVLSGLGYSFKN